MSAATKDLHDLLFDGTPINERLVHDLGGALIVDPRNVVLAGGTGTGKTDLAITIVQAAVPAPAAGSTRSSIWSIN